MKKIVRQNNRVSKTIYTVEKKNTWRKSLILAKRNYMLYIFLLPACLYIAIFYYGPMYGIQLAFKDFVANKGIWGSEWVGLKWFQMFFKSPRAWEIIRNTLYISYTL